MCIRDSYNGTLYYNYNGKIDEVAIFNRALNTTEISALYDGTGSNIRPSNLIASNLNPIAYYPLGEQAQNSGYLSASGNEWQFPNGVLQDYVMDFDGTDYIDTGVKPKDLIPSGGALTISAWLKSSVTGSQYVLGSYDFGTSPRERFFFKVASNEVLIGLGDGSSAISATVPTNQWYNVLVTFDGSSTVQAYINGDSQGTASISSTNWNTTNLTVLIGAYNDSRYGPYGFFNGKMSNVAIWNTAVTDSAQIANIYNNGSPQTSHTVSPQNWWKLNATSVYTPSAPNYSTALDFNNNSASNQKIIQAQNTNAFVADSGTISIWVKFASSSVNSLGLIGNGTTNSNVRINIYQSSNTVGLAWSTSSDTSFPTPVAITPDKWTHIAVTRNYDSTNTVAKFYINGIEQFTETLSGTITDKTYNDLLIGNLNDPFNVNRYWKGNVSNVALWDSALTASQISTLFNFGTPETNISFSPINWWKLNNLNSSSSADGLYDNGSSSINATLYSGTGTPVTVASTSVAVVPSWKIPSALTIPSVNYTSALDFTSTTDYIDTGQPSALGYGTATTAFSISIWANSSDWSNTYLFGNRGSGTGTNDSGFAFSTYAATSFAGLFFRVGNNTNLSATFNYSELQANIWTHFVIVYDGSGSTNSDKVKIYKDNSPLSLTFSANIPSTITSTLDFAIGAYTWATGRQGGWNGQISNSAIFNSALTTPQVSTLFNSGQPETSISFSPTNWWKLDAGGSTITDYGSGGNNGTNNGPATLVTSNVYIGNIPVNGVSTTLPSTALQQSDLQFDSPFSNYSLNFDGSSGLINCGSSLSFSTAMSISAWFKLSSSGQNGKCIISKHISGSSAPYFVFAIRTTTSNTIQFRVGLEDNSFPTITGSTSVNDTNWHHVVGIFDGSNISIYIDGSSDATAVSASGTLKSVTSKVIAIGGTVVGGVGGSSADLLNGKIDETSIFNCSLSEAQILEIYNNGKPGNLSNYSGTAPISWWRLGENAYFDNNAITVPNSISVSYTHLTLPTNREV